MKKIIVWSTFFITTYILFLSLSLSLNNSSQIKNLSSAKFMKFSKENSEKKDGYAWNKISPQEKESLVRGIKKIDPNSKTPFVNVLIYALDNFYQKNSNRHMTIKEAIEIVDWYKYPYPQ